MRVLASSLVKRAKDLANFSNSEFISFGELEGYLNDAYRSVYVDAITNGDFNYIKEIEISVGHGEGFTLPDDFFQLAYITCGGVDLERDYDYSIKNGFITFNTAVSNVKFAYYPNPETITFKPEKKEIGTLPITPISAWNSLLIDSNARIYDFQKGEYVKNTDSGAGSYILAENTYLNSTTKTAYDFNGSVDATYTTPILRSDGTFNEDIYSTGHAYGWGNEDGTEVYTVNDGNLYYTNEDGTNLIAENYTPGINAKILYLNGIFVLVDLKRINYPDGTWETTDVPKAKVLLKTSMETGYGYLAKDGTKYFLTGFLPETKIDFPNNIFYSLVEYTLAIDFRVKANSDTSDLRNAYQDRLGQYVATLSSDGFNYPTIRNVRSPFGHLAGF